LLDCFAASWWLLLLLLLGSAVLALAVVAGVAKHDSAAGNSSCDFGVTCRTLVNCSRCDE
jgi:hypothetical protein